MHPSEANRNARCFYKCKILDVLVSLRVAWVKKQYFIKVVNNSFRVAHFGIPLSIFFRWHSSGRTWLQPYFIGFCHAEVSQDCLFWCKISSVR